MSHFDDIMKLHEKKTFLPRPILDKKSDFQLYKILMTYSRKEPILFRQAYVFAEQTLNNRAHMMMALDYIGEHLALQNGDTSVSSYWSGMTSAGYLCFYCDKPVTLDQLIGIDLKSAMMDEETLEFLYDELPKRKDRSKSTHKYTIFPYVHQSSRGDVLNICPACFAKAKRKSESYLPRTWGWH